MNTKFPVLIGFAFGVAALVATAQPAMADVSIEIISRSNSGRSVTTENAQTFQPAPVSESTDGDSNQSQPELSLETEQNGTERTEDQFEGIVIRI